MKFTCRLILLPLMIAACCALILGFAVACGGAMIVWLFNRKASNGLS